MLLLSSLGDRTVLPSEECEVEIIIHLPKNVLMFHVCHLWFGARTELWSVNCPLYDSQIFPERDLTAMTSANQILIFVPCSAGT